MENLLNKERVKELSEFTRYSNVLLVSTILLFFTLGSILGVENPYGSFILTLLAMHFIVSHILELLDKGE